MQPQRNYSFGNEPERVVWTHCIANMVYHRKCDGKAYLDRKNLVFRCEKCGTVSNAVGLRHDK